MSTAKRAPLIEAIGRTVMRWQEATQAFDDAVADRLGLSRAERQALAVLYEGPKPAGAIAGAVGLTPAAVTALIDRLQERSLVARSRSDRDRRQVHVALTDRAIKQTMRYYGPIATEGAGILSGMSLAELEAVHAFLNKVLALQQRHLDEICGGTGKKRKRHTKGG
jgi:DNA-binding MarR family transcriptional regulator